MKLGSRAIFPIIFFTILLFNFRSSVINAQTVTEPPVPIYLIYQGDSLKTAYKDSLSAQREALIKAYKQIDTLKIQLQKVETERSTYITWLYILTALLLGLILLFLFFRTKEELLKNKVKRS